MLQRPASLDGGQARSGTRALDDALGRWLAIPGLRGRGAANRDCNAEQTDDEQCSRLPRWNVHGVPPRQESATSCYHSQCGQILIATTSHGAQRRRFAHEYFLAARDRFAILHHVASPLQPQPGLVQIENIGIERQVLGILAAWIIAADEELAELQRERNGSPGRAAEV